MKHNFEVEITAPSQAEAMEKLKAAMVFVKKFTTKELKRFAEVVENEPAKIALAKQALGL